MKYLKYLFIVAFSFILFSVDVSAIPIDEYMATVDPYDITIIPGYEYLNFEVLPMVSTFAVTDRYDKFEVMDVSDLYWRAYNNGNLVAHSSLVFGTTIQVNYNIKLQCVIENSNRPLFLEPGTLGIDFSCQGSSARLVFTTSTGSSVVDIQGVGIYGVTSHYITYDNSNADLKKIELIVEPSSLSSDSNSYLVYGGFFDYGYFEIDEPIEPEEPEVPLVGKDLSGTISYILSFIVSIVDTLFLLQIVEGVTFGYFILACMIFGLVFSFLFRNMVK